MTNTLKEPEAFQATEKMAYNPFRCGERASEDRKSKSLIVISLSSHSESLQIKCMQYIALRILKKG